MRIVTNRFGFESSTRRLAASWSGAVEFALTDPSRDPGKSLSPPTDCSSTCFWFFFLFLLFNIFENPLEPAFAVSGVPPACDFGLSAFESIDERPLLGPELSIACGSAEVARAWPGWALLGFSRAEGAGESSFKSGGLSITGSNVRGNARKRRCLKRPRAKTRELVP